MLLRGSKFFSTPLIFLCSIPLCAQSEASATTGHSQVPVFKANARAVEVDVVVTRENGEPVTSLHKEDFAATEDGKPQTIDYFEEHTTKNLPSGPVAPLANMPPNIYTNVPPVPQSDAVNVLLLDSLNTEPQDQVYVHQQIMLFLKTMEPGTQTAIFWLGSKLYYIQGFTTDSGVLAAALNDKKTEPGKEPVFQTRGDALDDAHTISALSAGFGGHAWPGLGALEKANAEYSTINYVNRVSMTLEALDYLARYLGAVPGRKNLIWFSGSFPVQVFPNLSERQDINDLEIGLSNVRRTADLMTISKVAVYPVGAQGMMNSTAMLADSAGPGLAPVVSGQRGSPMGLYTADAATRSDTIASMEQLAADTGGKAFFNTNDLNSAVKRAMDDGSHYYTIAYTPTNTKLDGSYRKIEVKVTAKGKYKTAYRRGYNADDTRKAAAPPDSDPLRPLLIRGLPGSTQLLYGVRVVPANPQPGQNAKRAGKNADLTGPTTRYDLDFMVRWQDVKLELTPQGTHRGTIQIALLAYDRDGKTVNWAGATQGMNLDANIYSAIQKSGIPVHAEIDLPNVDVYLETGVYDWGSGKAGTLEVPLQVGTAAVAATHPVSPKTN
jgi:VWFA-related protein